MCVLVEMSRVNSNFSNVSVSAGQTYSPCLCGTGKHVRESVRAGRRRETIQCKQIIQVRSPRYATRTSRVGAIRHTNMVCSQNRTSNRMQMTANWCYFRTALKANGSEISAAAGMGICCAIAGVFSAQFLLSQTNVGAVPVTGADDCAKTIFTRVRVHIVDIDVLICRHATAS
jgi:hypothetical protein